MATLSTSTKGGLRRIFFIDSSGKRKSIRLGKMPKKQADCILRHVEALVVAKLSNSTIEAETATWVGGLGAKLRVKLEQVGLVAASATTQPLTLKELIEKFLALQIVKQSTIDSYRQTTQSLIDYFGGTMKIAAIDAVAVDGWHRRLMAQGLATATVAKRINTAKSIFGKAVRWGSIAASPFAHLRPGKQNNPQRQVYVSREDIERVLAACPDAECRAIVGLARYAGLRCPSELITLRWGDIDFDRGVIRVHSTKLDAYGEKAVRDVPIEPRLRELLLDLPMGLNEDRVITRIASSETNMRKMLMSATKKAGLKQWPRAFQNLRASCEMDWTETVRPYVAASWIGHSVEVAAKHYVRVRDEHFERITGIKEGGAKSGANVVQNQTLQVAATEGTSPQPTPQPLTTDRHVLLGAHPYRDMRSIKVGDGGLEPSTSRV